MDMIKIPELLAPAGTLDAFKTAILYGADAIYAGLPGFSMRARAKITVDEVRAGIELAHRAGKKVYLAFNLFAHDRDFANMDAVSRVIDYLRPDALIVSDPGVVMWVRENHPDIPIHISTQANIPPRPSNFGSAPGPVCACWPAKSVIMNSNPFARRARMSGWKSLSMGRCVWRIQGGVCCPIISRDGRPTAGRARNCAGGNMMSFCANANPVLKCPSTKTNVAHIS